MTKQNTAKSEKKRPAIAVKKEVGTTPEQPDKKVKKEEVVEVEKPPTKLKSIAQTKAKKKTLCLFMTYDDDRASGKVGIKEADLLRLLALEKKNGSVQAYTISKEDSSHTRHLNLDLGAKAETFVKRVRDVWAGIVFDQVSFDWENNPESYFQEGNINVCKLLLSMAKSDPPMINEAGGAIYLPFRLSYFTAVSTNFPELEKYFNVAFVNEKIMEKENYLYRGTTALKDDPDTELVLNDGAIMKGNLNLQQIKSNGPIRNTPMSEVEDHYHQLCKRLGDDAVQSACTIRLHFRAPARG